MHEIIDNISAGGGGVWVKWNNAWDL